jgi:hypothetical protein
MCSSCCRDKASVWAIIGQAYRYDKQQQQQQQWQKQQHKWGFSQVSESSTKLHDSCNLAGGCRSVMEDMVD